MTEHNSENKMQDQYRLSAKVRRKIEHFLLRYPLTQRRSGVLYALSIVQEENGGSLTPELLDAVADYLEMPKIAVYEVATFYSMFHLEPVGEHVINVCTSISCMLRHSDEIVQHLKKRLGIELNQTTADNKFTLREVECLGACIGAPLFQIGKQYYEYLTPEKVDEILDALMQGKRVSHGE